MTTMYAAIIRHGDYQQKPETPSAFQPHPLTPSGFSQAQSCAHELHRFSQQLNVPIAQEMHTSIMLRAWQTCDRIKQYLPTPASAKPYYLTQTQQLAERCVGNLANLTLSEIEDVIANDPRYPAPPTGWKSDSHYQLPYPGAESLIQAGQRVAQYIHQTLSEQRTHHPQGCLQVFVGHGAAFRHAAFELGVLSFEEISRLSMYHAHPIILKCDKDQQWHHHQGDWKIRSLSKVKDLD